MVFYSVLIFLSVFQTDVLSRVTRKGTGNGDGEWRQLSAISSSVGRE